MSQITPSVDRVSKAITDNKVVNALDYQYYAYIPGYVSPDPQLFEAVYKELAPLVQAYGATYNGNPSIVNRVSCKFVDNTLSPYLVQFDKLIWKGSPFQYTDIVLRNWSESPYVSAIKAKLEKEFGDRFDYCLAHIYRDSKDNIGLHSDREALNTSVASISLGATRTFQIQGSYGFKQEFQLASGDLFYMKNECQKYFKHAVPVSSTPTTARINLTFRKLVG